MQNAHYHTNELTCPYCNYRDKDAEFDNECIVKCKNCNKEFIITSVQVERLYSTRKKDCIDHYWKTPPLNYKFTMCKKCDKEIWIPNGLCVENGKLTESVKYVTFSF